VYNYYSGICIAVLGIKPWVSSFVRQSVFGVYVLDRYKPQVTGLWSL